MNGGPDDEAVAGALSLSGLLGVLTAVISVHTDMRGWQKSLWLALMACLLIIEFQAIRKDRSVHDAETKEATRQQNDRFQRIADGLRASITMNVRQFRETNSEIEESLDCTNTVLKNVTGGSSYAVVILATFGEDQELSLLIENHGSNVLTGVSTFITPQELSPEECPLSLGKRSTDEKL